MDDFADLHHAWAEASEELDKERRIQNLIDDNGNFMFFFRKGDGLYGGAEESRIIFARMKNPDEETPEAWAREAFFPAYDLHKLVEEKPGAKTVFTYKDLPEIKVMDREDVRKQLR